MRKNIIILMFLVSSVIVFLPAVAGAASGNVVAKPQIRVQIGRNRHYDRGRHNGWYDGRRAYWYNYYPNDRRYVRRYYNDNGRRVVRWYWNY